MTKVLSPETQSPAQEGERLEWRVQEAEKEAEKIKQSGTDPHQVLG